MPTVAERLANAGLSLPAPARPAGAYVPAVSSAGLVFTSGQLPVVEGALLATGLVGLDVTAEAARECARVCMLNALAAAGTVCDLDTVARAVKLTGYVASANGFVSQPAVIDGASEVLAIAFGESGTHAREAVGVARLPLDAPVECSLVLALG